MQYFYVKHWIGLRIKRQHRPLGGLTLSSLMASPSGRDSFDRLLEKWHLSVKLSRMRCVGSNWLSEDLSIAFLSHCGLFTTKRNTAPLPTNFSSTAKARCEARLCFILYYLLSSGGKIHNQAKNHRRISPIAFMMSSLFICIPPKILLRKGSEYVAD